MIPRFLRQYYKSILIGILILWLSLSEDTSLNPGNILNIPHADKIGHFLVYLFFTLVLLLDSCRWNKTNRFRYIAILIPVALGALMELLQKTITTVRQAELADMEADIAGIIIGFFCALVVKKFLPAVRY